MTRSDGPAGGQRQTSINHQTIAVLHQSMTHEGQTGFLAFPLTIQPGIRVGRGLMSIIATLLTMKIYRTIMTTIRGRIVTVVLRLRSG